MVLKLRSLFRARLLVLTLKALVFAGFLGLVKIGGFGAIPILFFLAAAFTLYNSYSVSGSLSYMASFLNLILIVIFLGSKLENNVYWHYLLLFVIAALLFYILIGLKSLYFIYRQRWHYAFLLIISYLISVLFFSINKDTFFILKASIFFAAIYFLFKEFFRNSQLPINQEQAVLDTKLVTGKISQFAAIASLITMESLWAIDRLPLNILNSSSLVILVVFFITDIIRQYQANNLSKKHILIDFSAFVLLVILVFAFSTWNL